VTALRVDDTGLSLTRDDLPDRVQRRLHLIPRTGLGVVRRALAFALVAWLPIAIWALVVDQFVPGRSAQPFVAQFSVHARCLVAIPLFVLAEGTAFDLGRTILVRLVDQGFVTDADMPRLGAMLQRFVRLRNAATPWIAIAGIVVAVLLVAPTIERHEEVLFAPSGHLTFGGMWYLYVSRSLFLGLLLGWMWRLGLWTWALASIARLDLALVPTHPDRMFGIGVLARAPTAFWPLVLAISGVLAAVWAHDIVYEGARIQAYYVPMAIYVAIVLAVMLAPLLVFMPAFVAAKRRALGEYAGLLATHGRLVHRKWIRGEDVGAQPMLDAPELGPQVDVTAVFDAVSAQRPAPIDRRTLLAVLLPIAVPMIGVAALQVPVGELLLRLLRSVL
jgi:hypothetical protein